MHKVERRVTTTTRKYHHLKALRNMSSKNSLVTFPLPPNFVAQQAEKTQLITFTFKTQLVPFIQFGTYEKERVARMTEL